jgi:hypothetical protein
MVLVFGDMSILLEVAILTVFRILLAADEAAE